MQSLWHGCAGFETEDVDKPFHGRNKWPSESELPSFRDTMETYYGAMHKVAQKYAPISCA